MERIVCVSTNNSPDYYFYVPLVEWAWNKLGWRVAVFLTYDVEVESLTINNLETLLCRIPEIKGVRTGTLAQVGRHYSFHILPHDSYILLSDIDMIPLSDYIQPDYEKKTIWGWDLTGYGFVPVSYVGMKQEHWKNLMGEGGTMAQDMEKAMQRNGRAYMEKWEDYWDTDWEILTQKVNERRNEFTVIPRGLVSLSNDQTAYGRVDRYRMNETINQHPLIDCHAENSNPSSPEKWEMVRKAMIKGFGELPKWMDGYVTDFFKKYGR